MLRISIIVFTLITLLSLAAPLGCQSGDKLSKQEKKEELKKNKTKKVTEAAKDPVIIRDRNRELQLITFGPYEPEEGEGKPAEGNIFFQVTLNVTNELTTYSNLAAWDYWLIDSNGNEMEVIKKMTGWPEGHMIDLPPKELKRVTYIFEVPQGSGGYRLTSDNYVVIDLK